MSESLHIVRPALLSTYGSLATTPITVTIQSPALFQLLESTLRSNDGQRIIGTLIGSRSDDGSKLEVKDAYVVPHREEGDEVTIEEYHHKAQFQLHKRSNPKDLIIGWFSSSPSIDSFTALVHDFYSRSVDGTFPYPAIHLTLSQESEEIRDIPTINTYIASPIGAIGPTAANLKLEKGSSYVFTPIPNKISFDVQEQSVLKHASNVVHEEKDSIQLNSKSVDLELLLEHLNKVDLLISSTLAYIEKIERNEVKDDKFGKFLLSNLRTNVDSINLQELESSFNSHIQDTLMIEYLASSIKTQLELSAKLTTLV